MEQGVTLLALPSFRYTFDIIDLVERVQHYIFDHLNETVVYRLPTLFEVLVRGHDPVTKMFDTTAFKQTYTSDLFVREGSELSSLRHRRQTGYHDHRTIEDHEHGSGDHIHVGDQVIGDAAYHEHGSGGLEHEHEHGSGDHLHIFEAIVTPTTADRHDHGLGPHNHTAGIAHNHFHFNGMTIRLPSTYDTASRASSAIEEVQNELILLTTSATTDANAEDAEDVCFCDENMVFNDTGTSRVMSAATSCSESRGGICYETRRPLADATDAPYLGLSASSVRSGWVPADYDDEAIMKFPFPTTAMGVRVDSKGARVRVEVSSDYATSDAVFVGVASGDIRFPTPRDGRLSACALKRRPRLLRRLRLASDFPAHGATVAPIASRATTTASNAAARAAPAAPPPSPATPPPGQPPHPQSRR